MAFVLGSIVIIPGTAATTVQAAACTFIEWMTTKDQTIKAISNISEIAEKTSDMVATIGTTYDQVTECHSCVQTLKKSVDRFILQ